MWSSIQLSAVSTSVAAIGMLSKLAVLTRVSPAWVMPAYVVRPVGPGMLFCSSTVSLTARVVSWKPYQRYWLFSAIWSAGVMPMVEPSLKAEAVECRVGVQVEPRDEIVAREVGRGPGVAVVVVGQAHDLGRGRLVDSSTAKRPSAGSACQFGPISTRQLGDPRQDARYRVQLRLAGRASAGRPRPRRWASSGLGFWTILATSPSVCVARVGQDAVGGDAEFDRDGRVGIDDVVVVQRARGDDQVVALGRAGDVAELEVARAGELMSCSEPETGRQPELSSPGARPLAPVLASVGDQQSQSWLSRPPWVMAVMSPRRTDVFCAVGELVVGAQVAHEVGQGRGDVGRVRARAVAAQLHHRAGEREADPVEVVRLDAQRVAGGAVAVQRAVVRDQLQSAPAAARRASPSSPAGWSIAVTMSAGV